MQKIKFKRNGIECLTPCKIFKNIMVGSMGCSHCVNNKDILSEKKIVICNDSLKQENKNINYWIKVIERDLYEPDKIICHLDKIRQILNEGKK